jgi:hypothetical protein
VLGRLNPSYFLGGEMALDAAAGAQAIADRVATPLTLGSRRRRPPASSRSPTRT